MTDQEAEQKLNAILDATAGLIDALKGQTQAIYMLAAALSEDQEEEVSPYASLSEPPIDA